jgi:hypothetical protein
MTDEATPPKRGRGRPQGSTTGQTPLRTAKIGPLWDRSQELAKGQGMTMTAYVEEALRRENARVEKLPAKTTDGAA